MSKFTPGPWVRDGRMVEATNSEKETIMACEVYGPELGHWDQEAQVAAEANAQLIAAAPDLLDALVYLANWMEELIGFENETDPEYQEAMKQIDEAITRATGE